MAFLKKRIKEILTAQVASVAPEATASEAVRLMHENAISCIIVSSPQNKPLGIFTERNVVRCCASRGISFKQTLISQLMSSPVLTVTGEDYIYEAFDILGHSRIRHLVVVDDSGRACGIVTHSNLIEHLGLEYFSTVKTISQIMSKIVFCVPGEISLESALTEMADKNLSCLVVANEKKPLGIFTERDVTRLADQNADFKRLTLAQVMKTDLVCVDRNMPALEAARLMEARRVRRLIVLDEKKEIAGLTTQSNVVKGLEFKYNETLRELIREKDAELGLTAKELHAKTLYLDSILRSSIDLGIVATDNDYRINYFNPAAEKLTGFSAKRVVGLSVPQIHAELGLKLPNFERVMQLVRDNGYYVFEQNISEPQAKSVNCRISCIWNESAEVVGFVLTLRDVTERKKYEEAIRHIAYHDPLTGLPNRMLFNDRLQQELASVKRSQKMIGLLSIDLDWFKEVNDTLGHHAGDVLLQSLAARLGRLLREGDTLARMGGDEFLIIEPDINSKADAASLAERIAKAVELPFRIENTDVKVTASVGVAVYPEHAQDAESLLRTVDMAMYTAKRQKRKERCSCIYIAESC